MAPTLSPGQIGRELAACAVLGGCLGGARAFFPHRGRGAVLPDALWVGGMLLALQSYAAGESEGGVLRWYMLLGAVIAARCLAVPAGILRRTVLPAVRRARAARVERRKKRRNAKSAEKNAKKNLPNERPVLYNSNISSEE